MESLGLLTKFEQTALLVEDESVKLEIYIASMLALGCQKINKTPYIEKVLKVFLEKLKQFSQQSSFNEIDRLLNGILKALVLLSRTTGNAKLFPMISKQDIGSKKHPLHCFLFSDDIKSMKNAGFIIVQCSTALYAERLALTHLLSSNTDFSELYKKRTEEAEESNNSPMHEQKLSRLSVLNELIVQFLFVCELDDSLSSLLTEGLMKEQLCNIVINAALNKNTEDVNLKARDLIRSISTQISSSLSTWKKFDSLRQMAKRKLDSGYEPKSSLDKDQKGKDEVNEESDLESEDEFLEFFTLLDSPPELESEEETTSEDDEYEDEGN